MFPGIGIPFALAMLAFAFMSGPATLYMSAQTLTLWPKSRPDGHPGNPPRLLRPYRGGIRRAGRAPVPYARALPARPDGGCPLHAVAGRRDDLSHQGGVTNRIPSAACGAYYLRGRPTIDNGTEGGNS